jgi:hypothetical protein
MFVVRNVGVLWRRDKVDWSGQPGPNGRAKLEGYLRGKPEFTVDFRDQIGIYLLIDDRFDDRKVVYVGEAGLGKSSLYSRLKSHTHNHLAARWTRFSWFGLRTVNDDGTLRKNQGASNRVVHRTRRQALDEYEALLLEILEPPLNKQGPRWTETERYIQVRAKKAPPDDSEKLDLILKDVRATKARLKKIENEVANSKPKHGR